MVTMHDHIGESFAKHFILAVVRCGESIIFYVDWRIHQCTETSQNYLNCFPYIVLFRNPVCVSYLSLPDSGTGNLDLINTESWYISKNVWCFTEHKESGIGKTTISCNIYLLTEFLIIHIPEINKILRLIKRKTIISQGI